MIIDWRRIFRWCLLLAIAMGIWLMVPTVRCSSDAFRETPIGETTENVQQVDKDRVKQGAGFWDRLGTGVKACYRAHPPLSQERWKRNVFFGLLVLMAVAWVIDLIEKRRKRSYAK
jgi:hypothetical protein